MKPKCSRVPWDASLIVLAWRVLLDGILSAALCLVGDREAIEDAAQAAARTMARRVR